MYGDHYLSLTEISKLKNYTPQKHYLTNLAMDSGADTQYQIRR